MNYDDNDEDDNDEADIYLIWEQKASPLELTWYPVILEGSRLAWAWWLPPTLRRTGR